MKLRRSVPWLTAAVLAAGVASAAAVGFNEDYVWDEPPPPMSAAPSNLDTRVVDDAVGLILEPPASDVLPKVAGEDAVARAWVAEGAPGSPKAVHTTFALLSWGESFRNTPVWVVTYEGADCIQQGGVPGGPASPCVYQEFHTLIDATTGQYIASFTDPEAEQL